MGGRRRSDVACAASRPLALGRNHELFEKELIEVMGASPPVLVGTHPRRQLRVL